MKLKSIILGLLGIVMCTACGDDDDDKGGASINCTTFVTTDYLVLLEDLTDAQEAYTTDPTSENCEAYLTEVENYIEAWKAYIDKCVPQAAATWESYYSSWETTLANTSCD